MNAKFIQTSANPKGSKTPQVKLIIKVDEKDWEVSAPSGYRFLEVGEAVSKGDLEYDDFITTHPNKKIASFPWCEPGAVAFEIGDVISEDNRLVVRRISKFSVRKNSDPFFKWEVFDRFSPTQKQPGGLWSSRHNAREVAKGWNRSEV